MAVEDDRVPIGREPSDAWDGTDTQFADAEGWWTLSPSRDLRGSAASLLAAEQWVVVLEPPVMATFAALMQVIWAEGRTDVILTSGDLRRLLHPDLVTSFDDCIAALVTRGLVRRRPVARDSAYALSWRCLVAGPDAHRWAWSRSAWATICTPRPPMAPRPTCPSALPRPPVTTTSRR